MATADGGACRAPTAWSEFQQDPGSTKGQDDADHQRRERFDSSMAVGMIVIGRSYGDDHAQQHHRRREYIAGKLQARGDHRCRLGQDADHDIEGGEECTCSDSDKRNSAASPSVAAELSAHYHVGTARHRESLHQVTRH